MGRDGRGLPRRAGALGPRYAGPAQALQPGLEPRGPRPLQPRREPQGRRGAVRVPRHLHVAPVRPRQGPAPPARPGPARVRRGGEARPPALAAPARAARRRDVPLAQGDGRRGRDLPPAALHAARGLPAPERRPAARGGGRRGAHAGLLAREPAGAPGVTATVGGKAPSGLGTDALLDFRMERGARRRARSARARSRGCSRARTGWRSSAGSGWRSTADRLRRTLDELRRVERAAAADGVSFAEAMRMLAGRARGGRGRSGGAPIPTGRGWWRARGSQQTLEGLRSPEGLARVEPGRRSAGHAPAVPAGGVRWLYLLYRLGLGACLADDMGLGKTIQVLALLVVAEARGGRRRERPSLLVAPASLLANWAAEASASRRTCGCSSPIPRPCPPPS